VICKSTDVYERFLSKRIMKKVLILLAHPKYEHSVVTQSLVNAVSNLENVEIRDLYELYPDFNIDVQTEQETLIMADIIIWQHPVYWYSAPPLLKQWIDLVLEFGWAYGPGGIYLKGKQVFNATSSGGAKEAYSKEGKHGFTLKEFFLPFYQTAKLCNMSYLPPFQVNGTHKVTADYLRITAEKYRKIVRFLRDSESLPPEIYTLESLNQLTI
jgi:glutathione-regulated potassium-efflux system ancillary protein KefG